MKNWDRVASMLENRKTPQQCKDRWYMYLDPSVNKGEWTSDEEEKLVQLQELFPAQWELIASQIKGRMAWQCEQHFHALVESAGGAANVAPDALIAELRNRRMQQGGGGGSSSVATFDSAFETRAPRADAVDLDGKEQEMMATATARLANQDGKKQSRESRQQQLKETSFLTTLQRGREMEASGTLSHTAKRRRQSALSEMISNQGSSATNDNEEDGEDGFTSVEVIQSSARRISTKKNSLVMRKGITSEPTDDDDSFGQVGGGGAGGIDLAHLFSPSAPLGIGNSSSLLALPESAAPLPSSSIALDWSVLGEATSMIELPTDNSKSQQEVINTVDEQHSAVDSRRATSATSIVEEPVTNADIDTPLTYNDHWKHIAQELIDDECLASAAVNVLSEQQIADARLLVQQALAAASSNSQLFDKNVDDLRVTTVSHHELQHREPPTTSHSKRLREASPDTAVLEHTVEAINNERARTLELQSKLWFYKHVCLPAEGAEVKRRLAHAAETLARTRLHETFLQNDFLQSQALKK
ncbi:Myb-like DNA-binding domain, putative [Bodo saltans]|uniref:Myb-like DNA-binding domain, putative n=1 Tax=Bodo saltans TaxID=75058 RepID=A0A0S4JSD1_BODSA|nr:Myb-like DNA-binding domain, putative [Bodo saltans]|eukprot:CUG93136.1 Myb-like DNA-binding domain, putative [Bodo saltans]